MSYSPQKGRVANLIAPLLLFTLLLLLATLNHTFWRDESEVWLVARISPTISALLHNSRYEGHPPLWYVVIWSITRFTWNPEWMKLPNFLFAVAAAALILSADRLKLWVRIGLAFSYGMLFEYGLLARNYMIGIVFLIAAATLMRREHPRHAAVPILLALAALTSLPALIISMCLGVLYLWLVLRDTKDHTLSSLFSALGPKGLLGIALYVAAALIAAIAIRPPADSSLFLESAPAPASLFTKLGHCAHLIAESYLPLPRLTHTFWTTSLLGALPHHLDALMGLILLVGFLFFLRDPAVRGFFAAATAIELAQLIVSGRVTRRHIGWLFIILLLSILLDRVRSTYSNQPQSQSPLQPTEPWRKSLLAVVLACQVAAALISIAISFKYPFSSSKQVAAYLRDQHLDQSPLAFEPFYVGESVLAYLQRPSAYSLELHAPNSFVVWDRQEFLSRRTAPTPAELRAVSPIGAPPVLITEKPLTPAEMATLNLHLLASYTNAINTLDTYYIYR